MEAFLKLENFLQRKNAYDEKRRKAKLHDCELLKNFIQVYYKRIDFYSAFAFL